LGRAILHRTGLLIFEHRIQRAGASGFRHPILEKHVVNLMRANRELCRREPNAKARAWSASAIRPAELSAVVDCRPAVYRKRAVLRF